MNKQISEKAQIKQLDYNSRRTLTEACPHRAACRYNSADNQIDEEEIVKSGEFFDLNILSDNETQEGILHIASDKEDCEIKLKFQQTERFSKKDKESKSGITLEGILQPQEFESGNNIPNQTLQQFPYSCYHSSNNLRNQQSKMLGGTMQSNNRYCIKQTNENKNNDYSSAMFNDEADEDLIQEFEEQHNQFRRQNTCQNQIMIKQQYQNNFLKTEVFQGIGCGGGRRSSQRYQDRVKQLRVQSQETYQREAFNNTCQEDMASVEEDLDGFERAQAYTKNQLKEKEEMIQQSKYAITEIPIENTKKVSKPQRDSDKRMNNFQQFYILNSFQNQDPQQQTQIDDEIEEADLDDTEEAQVEVLFEKRQNNCQQLLSKPSEQQPYPQQMKYSQNQQKQQEQINQDLKNKLPQFQFMALQNRFSDIAHPQIGINKDAFTFQGQRQIEKQTASITNRTEDNVEEFREPLKEKTQEIVNQQTILMKTNEQNNKKKQILSIQVSAQCKRQSEYISGGGKLLKKEVSKTSKIKENGKGKKVQSKEERNFKREAINQNKRLTQFHYPSGINKNNNIGMNKWSFTNQENNFIDKKLKDQSQMGQEQQLKKKQQSDRGETLSHNLQNNVMQDQQKQQNKIDEELFLKLNKNHLNFVTNNMNNQELKQFKGSIGNNLKPQCADQNNNFNSKFLTDYSNASKRQSSITNIQNEKYKENNTKQEIDQNFINDNHNNSNHNPINKHANFNSNQNLIQNNILTSNSAIPLPSKSHSTHVLRAAQANAFQSAQNAMTSTNNPQIPNSQKSSAPLSQSSSNKQINNYIKETPETINRPKKNFFSNLIGGSGSNTQTISSLSSSSKRTNTKVCPPSSTASNTIPHTIASNSNSNSQSQTKIYQVSLALDQKQVIGLQQQQQQQLQQQQQQQNIQLNPKMSNQSSDQKNQQKCQQTERLSSNFIKTKQATKNQAIQNLNENHLYNNHKNVNEKDCKQQQQQQLQRCNSNSENPDKCEKRNLVLNQQPPYSIGAMPLGGGSKQNPYLYQAIQKNFQSTQMLNNQNHQASQMSFNNNTEAIQQLNSKRNSTASGNNSNKQSESRKSSTVGSQKVISKTNFKSGGTTRNSGRHQQSSNAGSIESNSKKKQTEIEKYYAIQQIDQKERIKNYDLVDRSPTSPTTMPHSFQKQEVIFNEQIVNVKQNQKALLNKNESGSKISLKQKMLHPSQQQEFNNEPHPDQFCQFYKGNTLYNDINSNNKGGMNLIEERTKDLKHQGAANLTPSILFNKVNEIENIKRVSANLVKSTLEKGQQQSILLKEKIKSSYQQQNSKKNNNTTFDSTALSQIYQQQQQVAVNNTNSSFMNHPQSNQMKENFNYIQNQLINTENNENKVNQQKQYKKIEKTLNKEEKGNSKIVGITYTIPVAPHQENQQKNQNKKGYYLNNIIIQNKNKKSINTGGNVNGPITATTQYQNTGKQSQLITQQEENVLTDLGELNGMEYRTFKVTSNDDINDDFEQRNFYDILNQQQLGAQYSLQQMQMGYSYGKQKEDRY